MYSSSPRFVLAKHTGLEIRSEAFGACMYENGLLSFSGIYPLVPATA